MRTQLETRLAELKAEFEKGQQRLQEIQLEEQNLRNTLLRIAGAAQVLEEELQKSGPENG